MRPMLATAVAHPPDGKGWVVERKLDGYRIIALAAPAGVRLWSRSGREVTAEMAQIATAVEELAARAPSLMPFVLDGEAVVQHGTEAPRFQAMQRFRDAGVGRLRYYVFDLLQLKGLSTLKQPLEERRRQLERLLRAGKKGKHTASGTLQLVPRLPGGPAAAFAAAAAAGEEGVVLKRAGSPYQAGERSDAWLKLKRVHTEDLVIGGYTAGQGARGGEIGALLVGARGEGAARGLVYAGHVGTGFGRETLRALRRRLEPLRTPRCTFAQRPPLREQTTWVRPELVAEVKYVERTADGIMRFPVFLRLRDDKSAAQADPAPAPVTVARPPRGVAAVLAQLEQLDAEGDLKVGRHVVHVTNLDKPLWPARRSKRLWRGADASLTKRDLLRYLAQVSPVLLRHLKDRPVTLTRHPHGAARAGFYQRHWDAAAPPFARSVAPVEDGGEPSGDPESLELRESPEREFIVVDSLAALLYAGQLGALELHPWYLRADSAAPDFIVFDLDSYLYAGSERAGEEPAPHAAGFDATRRAAWWLKAELDRLALPVYVKTSGKTGLHLFVPIRRRMGFDETHAFARTLCEHLERQHPRDLTTSWAVERRRGKVFLDYNQNRRGKTLAGAYSPRAAAGAPVSLPVTWEELDAVAPWEWTIHTVPERLASVGDPWADMLTRAPDLGRRLTGLPSRRQKDRTA